MMVKAHSSGQPTKATAGDRPTQSVAERPRQVMMQVVGHGDSLQALRHLGGGGAN